MKLTRKSLMIVSMCAIVLTGTPLLISGLSRFWEREYTGNTFHFHYENFIGFVSNTWGTYQTQTEVIELLNGKTMITITENTYLQPIAMDCTFTSTAGGLILIAEGQYVELYRVESNEVINDVGDPFNIPTDGTSLSLNEPAMMWADCYAPGIQGYALEITFTIDKSEIIETETGDYTYDVTIGIGTE